MNISMKQCAKASWNFDISFSEMIYCTQASNHNIKELINYIQYVWVALIMMIFQLKRASQSKIAINISEEVNSLPLSDAIRYWTTLSDAIRYWTTMAQIMTCCLMAPSHYLNQLWLGIIGVHPSAISQKTYKLWWLKLSSQNYFFIFFMHLPGVTELSNCNRDECLS